MKFLETAVVFDEVPDEITLAINIVGCEIQCPDCHSKQLWDKDLGKELNYTRLFLLMRQYTGITCICFMGGNESEIEEICKYIKKRWPNLKTAWYTGQEQVGQTVVEYLDYVKIGPYKKEYGPLTSSTTNQVFYRLIHYSNNKIQWINETSKFWKNETV